MAACPVCAQEFNFEVLGQRPTERINIVTFKANVDGRELICFVHSRCIGEWADTLFFGFKMGATSEDDMVVSMLEALDGG